jgi:ornithine carbamoyltransferase
MLPMFMPLDHRRLLVPPGLLSVQDQDNLLNCARSLTRAVEQGALPALLRGRRLGLLCELEGEAQAALFRSAATELGAQVARVRPSLHASSSAEDIRHTARLLGKLYDAVECVGMPEALVRMMNESAGIPIFDGLAGSAHPTAGLVERLDGAMAVDDKRRRVLQAALLCCIG